MRLKIQSKKMQNILEKRLDKLSKMSTNWAKKLNRGIEKELLRSDETGSLSLKAHPKSLGSALTHKYITTDYSESLLELISPPMQNSQNLLDFLLDLHSWCAQNIDEKELLWAHSMPCALPENSQIPIAEYGTSNQGKMRHIYRKGLDLRYGRSMQTIAGLHYNFSFPDEFWQIWQSLRTFEDAKIKFAQTQDIATDGYFALIRNFRRYSWIILYLFGSTPNFDVSFARNLQAFDKLEKLGKNSYGFTYATSLRMSSLGYQNPAQSSLSVCFNSLDEYTKSLMLATSTKYQDYEKKGVIKNGQYQQLNSNILQIENEFYSDIRPKRTSPYAEQPSKALMRSGVEYIEVRNLDINPFVLGGIDLMSMNFIDLFLIFCLLNKSEEITDKECTSITDNKNKITFLGRNKALKMDFLHSCKSLTKSGLALMEEMRPLAKFLDNLQNSQKYIQALDFQVEKFKNPNLTPSAIWLEKSEKKGFLQTALELAQNQMEELRARKISVRNLALFKELTQTSLKAQKALEEDKNTTFADYLKNYFA